MQIKFVFAGYRQAWVPVADRDEGVRVVRQAKENGVAVNDYGVPRLYFNFDLDLSGWTQADTDYLCGALGVVKARP